jgi:hypothetical protein
MKKKQATAMARVMARATTTVTATAMAMVTVNITMASNTTMTTTATATATATVTTSWSLNNDGELRNNNARWTAKCQAIRPMVAKILGIGHDMAMQAAVLYAVVNHPELVSTRKLAGIASLREQTANNFVCQQSARMMEQNWTTSGTRTAEKRDAVEVMLTFSAPLPDKTNDIPSMHQRA